MRNLILLHGAIGSGGQLAGLSALLNPYYKVHLLTFSGHGNIAANSDDFSMQGFAAEVLDYMNSRQIDHAAIFGYSMGGYAGMYLALHHPERVSKLVSLGTRYCWDPEIAAREIQLLDADTIQARFPAFASQLATLHAINDWKKVLAKTASMLLQMGEEPPITTAGFSLISQDVLLMIGDRDKMAGLEETLSIYRLLPHAQLAVLPACPHPIEKVNTEKLAEMIHEFLQRD